MRRDYQEGRRLVLHIILSIVGAIVGCSLKFVAAGVTGLNLYSILIAIVGVVVALQHVTNGGFASRERLRIN